MFTMLQFLNEQEALFRAIPVHSFCAAEAAEIELKVSSISFLCLKAEKSEVCLDP